jgi:sulfoxide reductase heme-binding subunit YedZ
MPADMILWEISRATGFTAFGLYTLNVAWGILLSAREWRPASAQFGFHRYLATLGVLAVATHVATLLLDPFAKVYPSTLVARDDRLEVLLGVGAMWLVLALPLSWWIKQRGWISQRVWRLFHYFGYGAWALMLAHGILNGTDSGAGWAVGTYAGAAGLVAASAWWRWVDKRRQLAARRNAKSMRAA